MELRGGLHPEEHLSNQISPQPPFHPSELGGWVFQFQPDCLSLGVSIPRPLQFQSDYLSLGASLLQNNRDQRTPITRLFQTRNFLVPNKDLTCLQQASRSPTGTSLLATSKFCSESNRHLLVCNKQVGGRWAQKTPLGAGLGCYIPIRAMATRTK